MKSYPALADSQAINFESYALGSVSGQNGWSNSVNPTYDQAVVSNVYGYPSFGTKTFRISDAVTSGSFGDWVFVKPLVDSVGETTATAGSFATGTKQKHFEMQFDIASTQSTQQPGLHVSVSPDRGDGSRMSYLRFEDQENGIHVMFDDVTDNGPIGTAASFNETDIATISRSAHTIKLTMDTLDGPGNDVVKVYVDGALVHTGKSWEDYYRFDPESSAEQSPRIVKTMIIQARGTATPTDSGKGFLFDNISLSSGPIPTPTPTPSPTPVNSFPVPAECRQDIAYHLITGTNKAESLNGTSGDDLILGKGGADKIDGKGGNDCIDAGDGADVVNGGNGDDVILGGDGADTLYGDAGKDSLYGGAGADVLFGGMNDDYLNGGAGADSARGENGQDTCVAESKNSCEL